MRSEARGQVRGGGAPAVVVGLRGRPRAETPAAREWQGRLEAIAPGRFHTMIRFHTMMLAMAVGAHASGRTSSARVRDPSGQWALLRASPLVGADEDQVAVVIEPGCEDQLLEMLMAAYGLSSREREVCREVIAGPSTTDMAARLFISGYTVQDHLKSVFAKAGVRSRGELVALLRPAEAATAAAETSS